MFKTGFQLSNGGMDFGHSLFQPSPVPHLLRDSFLFPNSYPFTVCHVCVHVHTLAYVHVSLCASVYETYADPVSVCMCVYSHMCILYVCVCACTRVRMCLCVFMDLYVCVPKYVVKTCVDMCITWIPPIGEMYIIILWSLAFLAPCDNPCEITDHFKHILYKNGSLSLLASPIVGGIP